MSPVRSAALLAFVLGRCCMKAISSSRVDSFGHHHLELGAGGSGKQTGSTGSGKHTRIFLQARRKIATTRWLLRAKQQFDFGGAVAQEIGQRRNKKGGGTKKELGRPRASEAASSFVGFLNPWVKEKAKQQQHQGSPTPRGRRKPRPAGHMVVAGSQACECPNTTGGRQRQVDEAMPEEDQYKKKESTTEVTKP